MDCICQYSLRWCLDSIYVMEIIHAEYLKGLLQSQSKKKCIGKSRCNNTCMYLHLESYTKLPVLRDVFVIRVALKSEDCCVNTAGGYPFYN